MNAIVAKQIIGVQALVEKVRAHSEQGQGLVEYATILGFVAILVLVALRYLQPTTSTLLNNVANSV